VTLWWLLACARPAEVRVAPPDEPLAGPPLFGFWGMNGSLTPDGLADVQERFGATVLQTATRHPEYAVQTLLPMARDAGFRVTLRLTGDHPRYTTPDGDFDLAAWKGMLDPWSGSGVEAFIDDGTLVGHMLLDDIHNFEGQDPDGAALDEMARYSHELFPDLMVFVRERATEMPEPPGGRYHHVDAVVHQYKASHGDVDRFVVVEGARAKALGVGVIAGLNIANGGDGSSGQAGWQEGRYAMSGAEILAYGSRLADEPGVLGLLAWEYDGEERWSDGSVGSAWFDQEAQRSALLGLSRRLVGATAVAPPGR
jgi:hypothetical protein